MAGILKLKYSREELIKLNNNNGLNYNTYTNIATYNLFRGAQTLRIQKKGKRPAFFRRRRNNESVARNSVLKKLHPLDSNSTKKNEQISIVLQNVQSLRNKLDCFKICDVLNYNILIFIETWMSLQEANALVLNNFTHFHCTRSTKNGGGISIFVMDHLKAILIHSLITEIFEVLILSVQFSKNFKCICVIFYFLRTPTITIIKEAFHAIENFIKPSENVILGGDINLDPFRDCNTWNYFLGKLCYYNIRPIFKFHRYDSTPPELCTRGQFAIDHFFANFVITDYFVMPSVFKSDHQALCINFPDSVLEDIKDNSTVIMNLSELDHDNLLYSLTSFPWESLTLIEHTFAAFF